MMNVFEKIREKLEELCEQTYYNSVNGNRYEGIRNNAYHNAIEIVNQVEKEHNNGWIPCSERLPEEDGFYLATLDGEIAGEEKPFSGLAEFENGKWVDDDEDYQCIIAWQPIPEPYKESDTNGKN